jgi:hypothetical protein
MDLIRRPGDLLTALRPIWVMSPDASPAAALLRPARTLRGRGWGSTTPATFRCREGAASLARGRQLVVAGDRYGLPPSGAGPSTLTALASVTDVHGWIWTMGGRRADSGTGAVPVPGGVVLNPGTEPVPPLRWETVPNGSGCRAGDRGRGPTNAEVQRVVDLVERHASRHPGESLMVVTLEQVHAERIEEALRVQGAAPPRSGSVAGVPRGRELAAAATVAGAPPPTTRWGWNVTT